MKQLILSLFAITLLTGLLTNPALAEEPPECEADYTIQPGDQLSEIAEKYYGNQQAYPQIVAANNTQSDDAYPDISNPDLIEPGVVLCLPPAAETATPQATMLELADGLPCAFVGTGATLVFHGKRLNYTCGFQGEDQIGLIGDVLMQNGDLIAEKVIISRNAGGFYIKETTDASGPAVVVSLGDGTQCLNAGQGATLAFDGKRLNFDCGSQGQEMVGLLGDLQFQRGLFMAEKAIIGRDAQGFLVKETAMTPAVLVSQKEPGSSQLPGSNWMVTGYNNDRETVVSILPDTELTANFGKNGSLSGSAGCNHYNAGYQVEGNNISIGAASSTQMACAEPEGVMQQDQEYLAALSTAATYQMAGNTMTLRTAEDAPAATFARAATVPTLADEVLNQITLVQHNFNPPTNRTTFTCASSGQGLIGVAPDPTGARFVGPNAGDFDLWGSVGLFEVNPDGSMEFVPQQTGGKFVSPDRFEFRRITLNRTLAYFANGQAIWTGDYGQPGRIAQCDPAFQ